MPSDLQRRYACAPPLPWKTRRQRDVSIQPTVLRCVLDHRSNGAGAGVADKGRRRNFEGHHPWSGRVETYAKRAFGFVLTTPHPGPSTIASHR